MEEARGLQDLYAPNSLCFGCGPANPMGLHIKSRPEGDELVCDWTPAAHHLAWEGALNGGIIGTLMDCHCNWTAAYHLMKTSGASKMPGTVTAEYTIKMLQPTPTDAPLQLRARVVETGGRSVVVEGSLESGGIRRATCRGVFIAVKPDHPAYHRW